MRVATARRSLAGLCATAMAVLALGAPVRAADNAVPVEAPVPVEDPMPVDVLPPPAPPRPVDIATLSEVDLYLYIVQQESRLMQCAGPLIQSKGGMHLAEKIYAAGRYPTLVDAAASVLGSQNSAVQTARAEDGSVLNIAALMVNLAAIGGSEKPRDMRDRLLRAKGVSIAALEIAGVSDGACTTPAGLVEAIARVPSEP